MSHIGINILLGLYLFGDKIIVDPENFDDPFAPFWVMIGLVVAYGVVEFSLYVFFLISRYACEDNTKPTESEIEMKQYGSAGGNPSKPKKDPSPVSWWLLNSKYYHTCNNNIIIM